MTVAADMTVWAKPISCFFLFSLMVCDHGISLGRQVDGLLTSFIACNLVAKQEF